MTNSGATCASKPATQYQSSRQRNLIARRFEAAWQRSDIVIALRRTTDIFDPCRRILLRFLFLSSPRSSHSTNCRTGSPRSTVRLWPNCSRLGRKMSPANSKRGSRGTFRGLPSRNRFDGGRATGTTRLNDRRRRRAQDCLVGRKCARHGASTSGGNARGTRGALQTAGGRLSRSLLALSSGANRAHLSHSAPLRGLPRPLGHARGNALRPSVGRRPDHIQGAV